MTADGVELVGDRFQAHPERGVVVLLHGGGQTRHSWTSTARALSIAGWTAITLDARGHGDSDWAPDGVYSMDVFVSDLVTVVSHLDTAPILIGASIGGLTSLLAVGEAHVAARGLVLVDVAPRVEPGGIERIRAFMTASPEGFGSLEAVADAIAAYSPHRLRPPTLDGIRKNVRQGKDGRWRWHWDPAFLDFDDEPTRALRHNRLLRGAKEVRIPTLMVRGAESDVVSEAGAAELLKAVPGAADVVVPGAGHMIAGDDNEVFNRELLSFLAKLDERQPARARCACGPAREVP